MGTDEILVGLGLTLAVAVGSQLVAVRLRIPAIIVLLPAGFLTGAATDTVDPNRLFGSTFAPLVSLAVAVILYDAGLALDLRGLRGETRQVVTRLIGLGVPITWAITTVTAGPLLGVSRSAAMMLGAILVVSGPTVVAPLLRFVRPDERLQRTLAWEGSLIDPVGGILGALTLNAILAGTHGRHPAEQLLQFLMSVAVGAAGLAVGGVVLWLVLVRLRPGEVLEAGAQVATVVAVAAACDAVRDDSGLIAAVLLGLLVANHDRFELPVRRPFLETLVQLVLGLLFVSISATVSPASLNHLVLPTLALVAVLVLAARPLVSAVATAWTTLTRRERMFVGWMAPRGIVAAATASSFSVALVAKGVAGAEKILPVTFLVIVATVAIYGLTAASVARWLGVVRVARSRPLLVGGGPWVVDLAVTLRLAGLDVVVWAPDEQQRDQLRRAGVELAPRELLAAAARQEMEFEGITSVLVLTDQEAFNTLAFAVLEAVGQDRVYRLPAGGQDEQIVGPGRRNARLFRAGLTGTTLARRHAAGERFLLRPAERSVPPRQDLLFVVTGKGELVPVREGPAPRVGPGDVAVVFGRPVIGVPAQEGRPAGADPSAGR